MNTFKTDNYTKSRKREILSIDICTKNAINTMLMIGALMIMATVMSEIIITTFEKVPMYGEKFTPYIRMFVYSFLEISKAVTLLAEISNEKFAFTFISAVLSWSGLCVLLQIKSCLPDGFTIKRVIRSKIVQSAISFFLAIIYKSFFKLNIKYESEFILKISAGLSVIVFFLFLIKSKKSSLEKVKK